MYENPYFQAQKGLVLLKSSIHTLLSAKYPSGLRNVDIGKALGIYTGHKGHEGHISRTLLEIMQNEGVIEQKEDKKWYLKVDEEDN